MRQIFYGLINLAKALTAGAYARPRLFRSIEWEAKINYIAIAGAQYYRP
jgi:hypothetical protein